MIEHTLKLFMFVMMMEHMVVCMLLEQVETSWFMYWPFLAFGLVSSVSIPVFDVSRIFTCPTNHTLILGCSMPGQNVFFSLEQHL